MYPTNPMHCIQQFRGATASPPRCACVLVILLQETDTVMALIVELWRNFHCLFHRLQGSGGCDAWGDVLDTSNCNYIHNTHAK
jgi:hypothetical protein